MLKAIFIGKANKKGEITKPELYQGIKLNSTKPAKDSKTNVLPMNLVNQFKGKNSSGAAVRYTAEHLDKGLTANNLYSVGYLAYEALKSTIEGGKLKVRKYFEVNPVQFLNICAQAMTFLLNRQKDDEAFLVFEFCRNIQKLIGISKAAPTIKLEYNGDLTDQQLEYIG